MNLEREPYRTRHFGPALTAPPTVSVAMVAYNHEAYIREALNSVFAQRTSFPIELVIGEDNSRDQTRKLIEIVCAGAPIPVRLVTSRQNVGMHQNFRRVLQACNGDFVALLEGDDYWIDSRKLTKQVEILVNEPNISMVFHKAKVRYDDGVETRDNYGPEGSEVPKLVCQRISFQQYFLAPFIRPTASVLYRRELISNIPAWSSELPFLDNVLLLMLLNHGDMAFINETMSVYRITEFGASSGNSYESVSRAMMKMFRCFAADALPQNKGVLLDVVDRHVFAFAAYLEHAARTDDAVCLLREHVQFQLRFRRWSPRTLKWYLRLRYPALHGRVTTLLG